MLIWDIVVINLCKAVYWLMRQRGSHGAALPGLIAEKLNPGLIHKLSQLPEGVIVVSGTNGKTTTTHLASEVLKRMGKRVFTNHSGSNMTRGLLASIIRYSTTTGKLHYDVAVLEIDEAYAAKLAPILKPKASILTNVLRDQLDRFGEIDHTARLLGKLADSTKKVVIYNASDSRLKKLHDSTAKARFVSYGFDPRLASHFPDDDALYDDSERKLSDNYDYKLQDTEASISLFGMSESTLRVNTSTLPGWHNRLNLCAVIGLVTELYGPQLDSIYDSLTPPYGRGESVKVGSGEYILQLVKNPAGFRTAIDVEIDQPALIIINDQIADSRDVSWLWDLDLSPLSSRPSLATSGTRGYDMAVRLKYAGLQTSFVELDEAVAIKKFISEHKKGVLFLTYTAMLKSRKILKGLQG
jgi:lipid II isoglutaminyl synthase (glutamine-hydrolysing)